MSVRRILIIADDLSGAADCALGGVDAGFDTIVICEAVPGIRRASVPAAQVIAIDTDSRQRPAQDAVRVHSEILARYRASGQLLYKKIDSTLRGHLAPELEPWLASAGMAIIAPAFPALGRTTLDGRQLIHGVALEDTPMWRASGRPAPGAIPAELAAHGIRCRQLSLSQLRQEVSALRVLLERMLREGVQAVVCDAATDDDLERLAQASIALENRVFWVGSAGLLQHLARAAALPSLARSQAAAAKEVAVNGAIVIVVGSFAEASRVQAEHLSACRPVARIAISTAMLRSDLSTPSWDTAKHRLRHALETGDDVVLAVDAGDNEEASAHRIPCTGLAEILAPHADAIGALVLTGGETARTVLSALGIDALRPLLEVAPGVPLSLAERGRALPVVTKAGAFGVAETLTRCYDELAGRRPVQSAPPGSMAAAPSYP